MLQESFASFKNFAYIAPHLLQWSFLIIFVIPACTALYASANEPLSILDHVLTL